MQWNWCYLQGFVVEEEKISVENYSYSATLVQLFTLKNNRLLLISSNSTSKSSQFVTSLILLLFLKISHSQTFFKKIPSLNNSQQYV